MLGEREEYIGHNNGIYEYDLRLQTSVCGEKGKSSTGDEGSQEGADEDYFETKLIRVLRLLGTISSHF